MGLSVIVDEGVGGEDINAKDFVQSISDLPSRSMAGPIGESKAVTPIWLDAVELRCFRIGLGSVLEAEDKASIFPTHYFVGGTGLDPDRRRTMWRNLYRFATAG